MALVTSMANKSTEIEYDYPRKVALIFKSCVGVSYIRGLSQ